MTKRRDDNLKERLKALRVNEPLKLNRDGFLMKPPQAKTEVAQIEPSLIQPPQSEGPQKDLAQFSTAVSGPSAPFRATLTNTAPEVEVTQNEGARSGEPRDEVAQSGPPKIEAAQKETINPPQVELPQVEGEEPQRESATPLGFFKLSHAAFSETLLRDLSGDCFRLFLWLSSRAWRYPTSGGVVRASVGFIELNAGMSHATISRGLKALKEKRLISIIEVDFKNGNLWQVSSLACGYPSSDDKPPHDKVPQNEAARIAGGGVSKRGGPSLKVRQQPPQCEQDLRSIKKIKNKKEVPKENLRLVCLGQLPEMETNDSALDNVEVGEIISSFEHGLPADEQSRFIDLFVAREFPHGFFPPMRVVRSLAAKDWWNGSQQPRFAAG